jgi:UDP-GlcNAc:undecaprenyl-phosphate/decaprenyl-phosphate GlcNAc-1-phosphate transferase
MIAYFYLAAFFGSLLASLVLTPLVRRLAKRAGFVDRPDGHRKLHSDAVALGGGIAVLLAVCATSIAVIGAAYAFAELPLDRRFFVGLLMAVAILMAVGLIDDAIGMRGRYKLAGQIAACLVLMAVGLQVFRLSVFGLRVDLGLLAVPVTLVWLLGTINAINLLDGADGLASSIGVLLCITVGALAAFGPGAHLDDSLLAVALAGALLGFLRYNFSPASIYLGDTGSMLIGLIVGAVAIHARIKSSTSVALAIPLCMLAIPVLDSCAALTRRKLTGRSLFAADRGHLHHTLLQRGCSVPQAVFVIVGLCSVTCLGALLSLYLQKDIVAIGTMIFVIVALMTCRVFGHVEFGLIVYHFSSGLRCWFLRSGLPRWLDRKSMNSNGIVQRAYHLYGSRDWNVLWAALSESAETLGLIRMEFRILLPSIHESFYAVWAKPNDAPEEERWSVNSPLFFGGRLAGNLMLIGHSHASAIQAIGAVADFLEPIEDQIMHSVADSRPLGDAATPSGRTERARETAPAKKNGKAAVHITESPAKAPFSGNGKDRSRRKHWAPLP